MTDLQDAIEVLLPTNESKSLTAEKLRDALTLLEEEIANNDGGVSGPEATISFSLAAWLGTDGSELQGFTDAPKLNAAGELTLTKNFNMTAGWAILSGTSKLGVGGVPNRSSGAPLQVTGAASFNSGIEFWNDTESANVHAFYQSGSNSLYTFILRNYFNTFTVSSIRAKFMTNAQFTDGSTTREATLANVITDDGSNAVTLDTFLNHYPESADYGAMHAGTRIIADGVWTLPTYSFSWKRISGAIIAAYEITPPTNDAGTGAKIDFKVPVYDKNGNEILGGVAVSGVIGKSVNYTVASSIGAVDVTAGATDKTITLPPLADDPGREIIVSLIDNLAGNAIVAANGAEKINGASTVTISEQYNSKRFMNMVTEWRVV